MQIKVLSNFGGKITGDRRILPGEYAVDDERLFGIAAYLLANGFAVVTDVGVPKAEATVKAELTVSVGEPIAVDMSVHYADVVYTGANERKLEINVGGETYIVAKAEGDEPRMLKLPKAHAEELVARGSWQYAEAVHVGA